MVKSMKAPPPEGYIIISVTGHHDGEGNEGSPSRDTLLFPVTGHHDGDVNEGSSGWDTLLFLLQDITMVKSMKALPQRDTLLFLFTGHHDGEVNEGSPGRSASRVRGCVRTEGDQAGPRPRSHGFGEEDRGLLALGQAYVGRHEVPRITHELRQGRIHR